MSSLNSRHSLGKNAFFKAILNLFNLVVPLLVGPYLNGMLSPESLGLYNRSLSEFQIFMMIGSYGLYNYGVREISRIREDSRAVARMFTSLFLIGLGLNAGISVLFIGFFLWRAQPSEWLVYSILLLQMLSNVFYIEFMNEAKENYQFITMKTIVVRVLYLGSVFIFVRKPDDVVPYALVVSLTILLNNFASYVHVRKRLQFDFQNLQIRTHLFPIFISILIVNADLLYAQVDRVLLAPFSSYLGMRGDVTVTLYSLSSNLIGMLAMVPAALLTVSMPRLSNLLAVEGSPAYQAKLAEMSERFLSLLLPLCIGMAVVAPEAMGMYSRNVYTYGWPILVWACINRIIFGLQFIVSQLILYINQAERTMTTLLVGCGIFNLFLKYLLIRTDRLTPTTATATTTFAVLVYVLMAWAWSRWNLQVEWKIFTRRNLGYLLASLLFLPLRLLSFHFLPGVYLPLAVTMIASGFIYAIFLILSKDPLAYILLKRLQKRG